MKIVEWADKIIQTILKVGIILVTIAVVVSMTLQVCGRYFLPLPLYGLDEFTGHTAVWFYFLGAAYSAAKSDHIKADMLEFFKIAPTGQYIISILTSLVSLIVSGFMVVWSYTYVMWSISRNELTPSLQIPTFYFQLAILVGAFLMFLYFLKELFSRFSRKQRFVKEEYESLVSNS